MKKVFITTVSQQATFEGVVYETEVKQLGNEKKEHYPIFNVMRNSVHPEDDIEVIAVKIPKNDSDREVDDNLGVLQDDIVEFEKEYSTKVKVTIIHQVAKAESSAHINLFKELLQVTPEAGDIYADITYGTKPTAITIMAALNCINIMRPYCDIERIIYGQIVEWEEDENARRIPKKALLNDVTDLFSFVSLTSTMDSIGGENIEVALRLMLGLQED